MKIELSSKQSAAPFPDRVDVDFPMLFEVTDRRGFMYVRLGLSWSLADNASKEARVDRGALGAVVQPFYEQWIKDRAEGLRGLERPNVQPSEYTFQSVIPDESDTRSRLIALLRAPK